MCAPDQAFNGDTQREENGQLITLLDNRGGDKYDFIDLKVFLISADNGVVKECDRLADELSEGTEDEGEFMLRCLS